MGTDNNQSQSGIVEIRMDFQGFMMIMAGVIMLCGFFFFLMVFNSVQGHFLGLGVLIIVIGIWRKRTPAIIFRQDHFETKLALAGGHHKLLYSEVVKVEITGRKLMTIYYHTHNAAADAAPMKIKLPLRSFEEAAREACVNAFHARLPQSLFVTV